MGQRLNVVASHVGYMDTNRVEMLQENYTHLGLGAQMARYVSLSSQFSNLCATKKQCKFISSFLLLTAK